MKTVLTVALLLTAPLGLTAKPRRRGEHLPFIKDRPVLFLWAAAATANALDVDTTETNLRLGASETDPAMRPIFQMPEPAVYAEQQAMIFGLAYLSHRMHESRHRWIRAVWWVPLALQFQANVRGYRQNRRAETAHANFIWR